MEPVRNAGEYDLSQDQVDHIMRTGEAAAPRKQRPIKIYDFRRPDKFSRDQIRTLSIMHETFAHQTTTSLSAMLRCLAQVHVVSVDQLTYEEFVRSIPNPTTIAIVAMEPLKTHAVLEIDPAVTSVMIDRLFGGPGRSIGSKRELTDIEMSLMEGLVTRLLGNLRVAWAPILDLQPQLGHIETNPMFAQIVPPNEMIVLVTMQAKIGDAEGMINFCIPYLTIEPVIPKLSARSVYSSLRRRVPHLGLSAAALPVTAEVFFDGDRVSLSTLQNLKKGALIGIPGYGAGNAFLQAGGARFLRLHAQRAREARGAYALAESQVAKDLVTLGAAGRPSGEAEAEAAQEALHSLSADIASTVKSLKGNIQELAKKQEELADQLIFQSPDQDLVPGDRGEKKHGPFGFITMAACETLATFLGQEHPQLIALVLSYLDPGLAACVLGKIPPGMQTDIAERICSIERTAPEVLRDVERVLEHKLSALSSKDLILAGGVESMVEILNAAPRGIEKNIVESLEKANRALAEEVKKRMFVFEDIVVLDRASVAKVLTETPADDLVLALKATDQKVRDLVWDCMAPSDAESLKARLESVGRARLTDVEAAQQRIVGVIRRMEEEGKIVVGRAGEMTS